MNQATLNQAIDTSNTARVLVVSAHCNKVVLDDDPLYCAIQVNNLFIKRVEALIALCTENNLERVTVSAGPEMWGPAGIEEEAKLSQAELTVQKDGKFCFTDHPGQKRHWFESKGITLGMLQAYLANSQEEVIFENDTVQSSYEDDH